jgi:hypothetical protein
MPIVRCPKPETMCGSASMCSSLRRGDMRRISTGTSSVFRCPGTFWSGFQDTYGFEMKDVFGNATLALGSYQYAVSSIIQGMTRVAWSLKKDELQKEIPGITRKRFLYNLSRSSYEKEWGREYHKPGSSTKLLTFLFRIISTSGPFRALKIRTPTPEVEKLFMASFNATVDRYKAMLANVEAGGPELANDNLDVGGATIAGNYKGTDEAYAKLLGKLADHLAWCVKPRVGLENYKINTDRKRNPC